MMDVETKWAEEILASKGYNLVEPFQSLIEAPWSSIARVSTTEGVIYLKQTAPDLFIEPFVIEILREKFHAYVPIVIATNKELNSFLMKDCGIPLREVFKNQFQLDILCEAIRQYTFIQAAVSTQCELFINLGVPDWRLEKLPKLYEELIAKEALLIEDGMAQAELKTLQGLSQELARLCEQLEKYKIPQTLDHCDFHDNNILFIPEKQKLTIIDWGECVITHPFFSILTCLGKAASSYHFNEQDKSYITLRDACFQNWLVYESKENLIKALYLAKKLCPIYTALAYYRLKVSSNPQTFYLYPRRMGRIAGPLKECIKSWV